MGSGDERSCVCKMVGLQGCDRYPVLGGWKLECWSSWPIFTLGVRRYLGSQ